MANYVREVRQHNGVSGSTQVRKTAVRERIQLSGVDRATLVIYNLISLVSGLILIRFILSLFGANRSNAFADFMYSITNPLVAPFQGLFNVSTTYGSSRFEIESLVAIIVYALVGWGIIALMNSGRRDITEVDPEI